MTKPQNKTISIKIENSQSEPDDEDILNFTEIEKITKSNHVKSYNDNSPKDSSITSRSSSDPSSNLSNSRQFRPQFAWECAETKPNAPKTNNVSNVPKEKQLAKFSASLKFPPSKNTTTASKSNILAPVDNNLWTEKYKPASEVELVIHKKKVEEVKEWLAKQTFYVQNHTSNACGLLLLTGPPGSGKTACLKQCALQQGFVVSEWLNPVHINWRDYNGNLVTEYTPRLKQFREFLRESRGYTDLTTDTTNNLRLIIVKDLPFLWEKKQQTEFVEIISQFLRTNRFPLVLICTESNNSDSPMIINTIQRTLALELQHLVHTVSFNPVAPSRMLQQLQRIAAAEKVDISQQQLKSLCESSNGDLRHATNALQMLAIAPTGKSGQKRKKSNTENSSSTLSASRDTTLSLFHAVGKVLYNKREGPVDSDLHEEGSKKKPKKSKKSTEGRNFIPEELPENSSVEPGFFINFVHENLLHFVSSVEDTSCALDYLSMADTFSKNSLLEPTLNHYVSSVGIRGVLFANQHPAPRKFQALYKSQIPSTSRDAKENSQFLQTFYYATFPAGNLIPLAVLQTQIIPYLHCICNNPKSPPASRQPALHTICTYIDKTNPPPKFGQILDTPLTELKSHDNSNLHDDIED